MKQVRGYGIDSSSSGEGPLADICKQYNEYLGFINGRQFVE
jgi:hypothetical protein